MVPTIYKAYFSGLNFREYHPQIWHIPHPHCYGWFTQKETLNLRAITLGVITIKSPSKTNQIKSRELYACEIMWVCVYIYTRIYIYIYISIYIYIYIYISIYIYIYISIYIYTWLPGMRLTTVNKTLIWPSDQNKIKTHINLTQDYLIILFWSKYYPLVN